jgi:hypothetical protein
MYYERLRPKDKTKKDKQRNINILQRGRREKWERETIIGKRDREEEKRDKGIKITKESKKVEKNEREKLIEDNTRETNK